MKARRLAGDEGYATVTSAGIIAAVTSLMVLVVGVGARVADSHRAQLAADLAATAGATAHYSGVDACRVAAETAERNGATLTGCEQREWDVLVRVEVDAGALPSAVAESRAGPGPSEVPET